MKTYLAISTGQNITNVLPIMDSWEAGDHLLWLESDEARKQHWSEGALQVLEQRGVTSLERLSFAEQPDSLLRVLQKLFQRMDTNIPVVWIGNGGTKPQALAVEQALAGWGGKSIYAYSTHRPVRYEAFPEGLAEKPKFLAYQKEPPIQLEELLTISGHVVRGDKPPQQLWPGKAPAETDNGYGSDPAVTFDDCEQRFSWLQIKRNEADQTRLLLLRMPHLREKNPQLYAQWWNKMRRHWMDLCKRLKMEGTPQQQFDPLFNSVIGLAEQAYQQERQNAWRQQATAPQDSGGQLFERAVARRLYAWLEAPGNDAVRRILAGVWANVHIAREKAPGVVAQELDLALLLRNGVLLAIECKAGQFDIKDLDARLLNMQASASLASAMAIAVPAFTDYRNRPGAIEMIRRWKRLQQLPRFRALPFTLPGQSTTWEDADTGDSLKVPSFEETMNNWLRPYLP